MHNSYLSVMHIPIFEEMAVHIIRFCIGKLLMNSDLMEGAVTEDFHRIDP